MTVVACQQLAPSLGNLRHNAELSSNAVAEAAAAGADVIVLPELITSGYVFETRAEARAASITPAHELFDAWRRAAGTGRVVIGGFAETGPDDSVFNSLVVLHEDAPAVVYRKAHLWDREKLWFTPGDAMPPVVDTSQGRIAAMICYDMEFPEMTRSVAMRGAQLLAVPTNWPFFPRPTGERAPEVVIAMAAARVNRMAIACCDRDGVERGVEWTRGSTIVSAEGWPLAEFTGGNLVLADVDLAFADDKVISERNDLLGDRRIDLY